MMKVPFAQRLKECLDQQRLKQSEFLALVQPISETCGVKLSKSDLSQYLTGKTGPNPDKLYLMATALDVDMAWLQGYDVPQRKAVTVLDLDSIPGVMAVRAEERRLIELYRGAQEVYRGVAAEILAAHQITDDI